MDKASILPSISADSLRLDNLFRKDHSLRLPGAELSRVATRPVDHGMNQVSHSWVPDSYIGMRFYVVITCERYGSRYEPCPPG